MGADRRSDGGAGFNFEMIVAVACSWAEDSESREQSSSDEIDLEAFRADVRKMTDEELFRQG